MSLWPQLLEAKAREFAEREGDGPLRPAAWGIDRTVISEDHLGGRGVDPALIREVVERIRALAVECGYPERSLEGRQRFDRACGPVLAASMGLTAQQATREGVWQWLACVAVPDLVRWRFRPVRRTGRVNPERFLRLNRNLLGRLWWRAHLLRDPEAADPWHLMQLYEDNMVALVERTRSIASCPSIILSFGRNCIRIDPDRRMPVMRDATKRVLRMLPVVPLRCLDAATVEEHVRAAFEESLRHVRGHESARAFEEE